MLFRLMKTPINGTFAFAILKTQIIMTLTKTRIIGPPPPLGGPINEVSLYSESSCKMEHFRSTEPLNRSIFIIQGGPKKWIFWGKIGTKF